MPSLKYLLSLLKKDIHEGAEIKLISETGEAELIAHVTDRVKEKKFTFL